MFTTRHDRVAGLGNSEGSQRALNMLFAIRTIQQRTGKDLGATFLSGTTISNSLTELYLLFKYLRPNELERQGIRSFDAWAAVFARKSIDYEFSVTNEIVQKERFRYFIKVPELASFYSEITDFRTAEDITSARRRTSASTARRRTRYCTTSRPRPTSRSSSPGSWSSPRPAMPPYWAVRR